MVMKKLLILLIILIKIGLFSHDTFILNLPSGKEDNGIKWTSFPVLKRTQKDSCKVSYVLKPIMSEISSETSLEKILYKRAGIPVEMIFFDQFFWVNSNHILDSSVGYKIKMLPTSNPVKIKISGTLENPKRKIKLYHGMENWIGYFIKKSQTIQDAFGEDVLQHITMIKAQHWFWINPKIYSYLPNLTATLNFADMIVVYCDTDIEFSWSDKKSTKPFVKKTTRHFNPEEKTNYIPFLVKIPDEFIKRDYSELGIFLNDICIGSSVITDTILTIPLYYKSILKDPYNDLVFSIYNKKNNKYQTYRNYLTFDTKKNKFDKNPITFNEHPPFYFIKLLSNLSNEEKNILLNIINNPEKQQVFINYYLPTEQNLKIAIYDMNDNQITTLVNGKQISGSYQLIWEYKSERGLYFCKLITKDKILKKKIILVR